MAYEYVPPGQDPFGSPGGGSTQYQPPVGTLAGQTGVPPPGFGGVSGGGDPTLAAGDTKEIKLSDGRTVIVDMQDGHVLASYGTAGEEFSQKQQLQSQSEASAASREASSEAAASQRQASSEAAAQQRQDTSLAQNPWSQMMPKWVSPSTVTGERGALDILDPNTGQLTSVRQPGPPPVRIVGGNLIVDPGANAAVYYNGNKGQPTNISGGPQMLNRSATFPGTMGQAQQIAGMIQGRGGASGGASGSMRGGSSSGGGGMGGGPAAGSRFANPGGGAGGMSRGNVNPAAPSFTSPMNGPTNGPTNGPMPGPRPPWESPDWQDPYNVPAGPSGPPGPTVDLSGYNTDVERPFFNPESFQTDLNDYHPEIDWERGNYG